MNAIRVKKGNTYLRYILIFSFTFLFVYIWIFLNGRTLISSWDALTQHYTALCYIGDYLKEIIVNFPQGFKEFDFNLGLGSDIIHTFSYYGLGDIELLVLAALCPKMLMEVLYCFLVYSKMLLAGFCFLRLTEELQFDRNASLIAGLAYVYCNFALESSWGHYFFLNALIMLPLLICELEKKIRGKKNYFWIAVVFSVCANYYFFYMCALATALYGIVRAWQCLDTWKERIWVWLLCVKDVIVAILVGAPFIFPTIYGFLNSSRTESGIVLKDILWIEPIEAVKRLVETVNGLVSWETVGVSCIVLLGLITLFCQKKKISIKIYVIIGALLLMSPVTGFVFNAFSYVSYRYLFVYAFFLCLLFAYVNPFEMNGNKKFLWGSLVSFIFMGVYFSRQITNAEGLILLCPLLCGIIATICIYKEVQYKYKYIVILCMLSIVLHAWTDAGPLKIGEYIPGRMVGMGAANKLASSINLLDFDTLQEDNGVYRVSSSNDIVMYENYGIASGQSTIEMYYSVMNKYYINAMQDMENSEQYISNVIRGFDKRTEIAELLSNKYYITNEGEEIPYGYDVVETREDKVLCLNNYWLPMAYFYDSYVTEDMIENQNGLQKAALYLRTAVLEEAIEEVSLGNAESDYVKLENGSVYLDGNNIEDDMIVSKNGILRVEFSGIENAQYVLRLKGYKGNGEAHTVIVTSELGEQVYAINGIDNRYYTDSDAKAFNLGYCQGELKSCEVIIESQDDVYIEEVEVWALPIEKYVNAMETLQAGAADNMLVGTDYVECTFTCDEAGVIYFSIPYSDGWCAYVNDQKVDILKVNGSFMGVAVEKGNYEVRIEYKSPWFREGIFVSVVMLSLMVIWSVYKKIKE